MVHLLFYSPRLKRQVKADLVTAFSRIVVQAVGDPAWKPVIHLQEHPYDNVGVDGQLLSDRYPELGERTFYFDLDDE
jgi:4-oxalocrotonate tautomerase